MKPFEKLTMCLLVLVFAGAISLDAAESTRSNPFRAGSAPVTKEPVSSGAKIIPPRIPDVQTEKLEPRSGQVVPSGTAAINDQETFLQMPPTAPPETISRNHESQAQEVLFAKCPVGYDCRWAETGSSEVECIRSEHAFHAQAGGMCRRDSDGHRRTENPYAPALRVAQGKTFAGGL